MGGGQIFEDEKSNSKRTPHLTHSDIDTNFNPNKQLLKL